MQVCDAQLNRGACTQVGLILAVGGERDRRIFGVLAAKRRAGGRVVLMW